MLDNLSDNEKSWLLIRAADLKIYFDHEPIGPPDDLLYNKYYMHEAWRLHLWAMRLSDNHSRELTNRYNNFWTHEYPWKKTDAQRLWLDKILSLLIEAGKVEVNHDHES